ncbi:MAG: hypothetical protein GEU93_06875 [Propionibacteriales bacterium]|nr:hypothetical protein [Propionibacteriales bacterium]
MQKSRNLLKLATAAALLTLLPAACGGDPAVTESGSTEEPAEEGTGGGGDVGEIEGDDVHIVFGHYLPSGAGTAPEEHFAELIEEYTAGTVTVEIGYSESLGGADELIYLVEEGAVDMAAVVPAFTPDAFPAASITQMIWWSSQVDETDLRRQHDLIMEMHSMDLIEQELADYNVRRTMVQNLPPYYLFSDGADCTIDGISGDRIRSLGTEYPQMLKAIGAAPVEMVTAEIYEALERGTLDRASLPPDVFLDFDMASVAPDACGPIFWLGAGHQILLNMDTWGELSSDQQEAIDRAAMEAQEWSIDYYIERQEDLLAQLEEDGVEVQAMAEDEFAEWQERSPDFADQWLKRMQDAGNGDAAQEIYDKLREIEQREY